FYLPPGSLLWKPKICLTSRQSLLTMAFSAEQSFVWRKKTANLLYIPPEECKNGGKNRPLLIFYRRNQHKGQFSGQ
ncbi:MAG: hypothetical protein II795_02100, partial [Firmicutes bacterium]|nr:hypothetical protein [Bacillota bacterium]